MRILVIGTGGQAAIHAAAIAAHAEAELAGALGRSSERTRVFADRFDIEAFTDPETAFSEAGADAAVIASPTVTHRRLSEAALGAGLHVLCETPLAGTSVDATAMIAAADKAGRVLQAGLIHRFDTENADLRERVLTGDLGKILTVSTQRLWAPACRGLRPRPEDDHYGDVIEELLLFDIDYLNWVFGEPETVRASGLVREGRLEQVVAGFSFEGPRASCEASALMPAGRPFNSGIRIVGTQGSAELDFQFAKNAPPEIRYVVHRPGREAEVMPPSEADPWQAQIDAFLKAMAEGPDAANSREALAALRVGEAVREAVLRGDAVRTAL